MKKGFTYLLFSALLLGNSFTFLPAHDLVPEEASNVQEDSMTRTVDGASALFTAVAYVPDMEIKEAIVQESENELPVTNDEESVTESEPETELVVESEIKEEETLSQKEPEHTGSDDEPSDSLPVVTTENKQEEPAQEPAQKEPEKKKQQTTKPEITDSSKKAEEKPEETQTPPVSEVKEDTAPVEEEISLYEEEATVLNAVTSQLAFDAEGHQFFLTKLDDTLYQVEIRHSNPQGDVDISNMTGIYHYNLETGRLSVMDPITGEFN